MNYRFILTTIIFSSFCWITVKLEDYPKLSPEVLHVRQGDNIAAKCMVKDLGTIPSNYSFGWNLNDRKNGTAFEVTSNANVKILKINNVRPDDAGSYRCRLSSDGGVISTVRTLKIIVVIVTDEVLICKGQYHCRDGVFIPCPARCDGRPDCLDEDDEIGCSKPKEIYPKETEVEYDHTAWLKTTVYTVIACTVGVVLFISIVVIAVCRIKMKRAAVRRAMHQSERRRRNAHQSSDSQGNSLRAQRNNAVEHEPFISAPSPTHFGNIIVNVNNGVQYVPNVDFHSIIQAPPSYQEVLAETQREALIGRHSPPPIYSTIDRNPHHLASEGGDQASTQVLDSSANPSTSIVSDSQSNRCDILQEGRRANNPSDQINGRNRNNNGNRTSFCVPGTFSDNNFQTSQPVIVSARDGTRSLERLCRNRQGGSRSRPNVRSVASPRRPKQLQVRGGQIILDENSSASSSPETVNRNTQTNPADISQTNTSSLASQNADNSQNSQREINSPNTNLTSPSQNKPAQLRVQAGQIVLEGGQSDIQTLMTTSVTNDLEGGASGQGHLEVKDGHIVFKTP